VNVILKGETIDLWGTCIIQGKNSTKDIPAPARAVKSKSLSISWTALSCPEASVGWSYNMDMIVEVVVRWMCCSRLSGFARRADTKIVASFVRVG
jgi:hypothetical protein